jgi:lipoic acid synthetase
MRRASADYDKPGVLGQKPLRGGATQGAHAQHVRVQSFRALADGGSELWARTIRAVRHANPGVSIEVLIPDFKGSAANLARVLDAAPDILNHNLETVPALYPLVRPQARYGRSLELLRRAKARGFTTKTGLMLGLGESEEELRQVFQDLVDTKVDILTLGQYLRPSKNHLPVKRWVTPEDFARLRDTALTLGLGVCESGPLVRSSYHADAQSEKYTRPPAVTRAPQILPARQSAGETSNA